MNAICDSTYFEPVLNVSVPTMTSNTTPSGKAFSSSPANGWEAYRAFDGNDSTFFGSQTSEVYIGYEFVNKVCVKKLYSYTIQWFYTKLKLQASNDGINWIDITDTIVFNNPQTLNISNNGYYFYWRLITVGKDETNETFTSLQFWGRS